MQTLSNDTFGPLIAYLVPGATALLGLQSVIPVVHDWFVVLPPSSPTISGFLFLTVASLAMGMTVSAIRWATIDTLFAATGLRLPRLDFGLLKGNVDAMQLLIEIHYRHYQYYANMLVALVIAYAGQRSQWGPFGWLDVAIVFLVGIFLAASRDTLRKYYTRLGQLLAPTPPPSTAAPVSERTR